jgi:exocyst complex component 1
MAVVYPGNIEGEGLIHKSKMNSNGTFSVGKTWRLNELRGVEVTDVSCMFASWSRRVLTPAQPLTFNVTLARTYRWQTEKASEQVEFLNVLVDLFRSVSGGTLQVIGLAEPGIRSGEMHFCSYDRGSPLSAVRPLAAEGPSRTPTPPITAPQPFDARRLRNTASRDLRGYEDLPSSYPSVPVAEAPSISRRGPSPVSSGPPSPLDSTTGIIPSPRPRRTSQSSSSTVRLRGTWVAGPPSSSKMLGGSDVSSTQIQSTSRLSVTTASSETQSSKDQYSFHASGSSLDVPSTATSVSRSPTSVLAPSEFRRSPSPVSSSYSKKRTNAQTRGPSVPPEQAQHRREQKARISFFDPANQSALDRLIFRGSGTSDPEGEEEGTQDIMANVEEMLEGYEWASDDILGRMRGRGAVDQIEARLLDELMALEKVFDFIMARDDNCKWPFFQANVHSFIETDDRVTLVLNFLDEAINELDNMDGLVSSYKIHLNAS